jgi:dethiobiotin synthetase
MNKGIFIAGTDTDAGKTYIACEIARALKAAGTSTGVMKPICSGGRDDAKKLISASGSRDRIGLVNPVFLKYPLAPLVSARLSWENISLSTIKRTYREIAKIHDFMVVEGVGGIYVPLKKGYFVFDLIKEFSLPVLVVAKPYLGTINHTLLTVNKLQKEGVKVAGIIISGGNGKTLAEKSNATILRELTGLPVESIKRNGSINIRKNKWITG